MERPLISPATYRAALAMRDLTDIAHGPHAMQLLVHAAVDCLRNTWSCPVIVHRSHPVVSTAETTNCWTTRWTPPPATFVTRAM